MRARENRSGSPPDSEGIATSTQHLPLDELACPPRSGAPSARAETRDHGVGDKQALHLAARDEYLTSPQLAGGSLRFRASHSAKRPNRYNSASGRNRSPTDIPASVSMDWPAYQISLTAGSDVDAKDSDFGGEQR